MPRRFRSRHQEVLNSSFYETLISESRDQLIKNYLLKLYNAELNSESVEVLKVLGLNSSEVITPRHPISNLNSANNTYSFNDSILLFSINFLGEDYEFCFIVTRDSGLIDNTFYYTLKISGLSRNANRPADLLNIIIRESITNSSFNNNICSYRLVDSNDSENKFIESLKLIEPKNVSIDDIFLPDDKKEQIQRFIYAIKNHKNDKINLRYLLSGVPGTGKTQIMNSIISCIKSEATVILTEGSSFSTINLFDFSSLFELTLLIIDDVDFLIGNRVDGYNRKALGAFLQYLDGFIPNNIFLLASTNDKTLVDIAASRPGRFDLILDISEIQQKNYVDLIKRETNDESIIEFFDDETLAMLKSRRVTGAFLVSLVKQLKSLKRMNNSLTRENFNKMLNLTYGGFYNSNAENLKTAVGF